MMRLDSLLLIGAMEIRSYYLYQKAKGRPTDDPLLFSRTINRLSLKHFIYAQSES